METPTNNISGNVSRVRRLGLSRSIIRSKQTPTTPVEVDSIDKSNDVSTPVETTEKISQFETERPANYNSINLHETPVSSKLIRPKFNLTSSTTSKSVTGKRRRNLLSIQPKRLKLEDLAPEFDSVNESECVNCDSSDKPTIVGEKDSTNKVMTTEIAEMKSTISKIEKYEQRSSDLLALITKWREAGKKVIKELEEKIQPKQDIETILKHFSIDPALFNVE